MAVTIVIPTPLRQFAGGKSEVELEAATAGEALEVIIDMGCERILTSGQQRTAIEGTQLIKDLIQQADGRIEIMPGSGIRAQNILEIKDKTGAKEFHSSARTLKKSAMTFVQPFMTEDPSTFIADEQEIKQMITLLMQAEQ